MLHLFLIILTAIIALHYIINRARTSSKCAYVVILGDIGRSPRMQFHSVTLSKAGFEVYIFGYAGK